MTDTTRFHLLAAALLLAAAILGACGRGAPGAGAAQTSSKGAALTSGAGCPETSVHAKHLNLFACRTCHPQGAAFGFDQPYTFAGGTTTAGGAIALGANGAATSCTVACHYPKGGPAKAVAWDAPGPLACVDCHAASALPQGHPAVAANATRAECQGCHVTSGHLDGSVLLVAHEAAWMDRTSPAFHAFSANAGLTACKTCHEADLSGGATHVACAHCHDVKDAGGVVVKAWKTNCTMCHGGVDDQSGAPPAATWGHAGDPNRGSGALDAVRVGAHRVHLAGSALAPPFGCGVCHQVPADALSDGHVDGPNATVSFAGLGAAGVVPPLPPPAWDRASATCSSVYCHGATLVGGTRTAPVWTGGPSEAPCGGCHGVPPVSSKHPPVSGGLAGCNACHSLTIDAGGALIPPGAGGKHLDGTIEATGGHAASWSDPASTDFHAFSANRGIASCTSCHGADLAGGSTGFACVDCHNAGGPGRDFATCTACHGGTHDASGAPPAATWGYAGDPSPGAGAADPVRVGAHRKHQVPALAAPLDCGACHVKPASVLSPGHIEAPVALVTWGALARTGGAEPFWNRVDATCSSTYCHGNYAGTYRYTVWDWGIDAPVEVSVAYAGKKAAPVWTDGPMTCDSCHGASGATGGVWHSGLHALSIPTGNSCELCHPDASGRVSDGTQRITNPALHINGSVEVTPQFGTRCIGCH